MRLYKSVILIKSDDYNMVTQMAIIISLPPSLLLCIMILLRQYLVGILGSTNEWNFILIVIKTSTI